MLKIILLLLISFSVYATDWYTGGSNPAQGSPLNSSVMRSEFSSISSSFQKLPPYSGYGPGTSGGFAVGVNNSGTGLTTYTNSSFLVNIGAQPLNTNLTALSAVTPSALGLLWLAEPSTTQAMTDLGISSLGQSLIADTTVSAMQSTLNLVPGTAANNIVQLNGSSQLPAVDGSMLLNIGSAQNRQTVLAGPTDSNGNASFGGSTGGTSITTSGPIAVTAAEGYNQYGAVNQIGLGTPTWTGLSTPNTTYYLYVLVTSSHTLTTFNSTIAPIYSNHLSTLPTANGAFAFDWSIMTAFLGNGTTYQTNQFPVLVGVATTNGSGNVNSIAWFAMNGRYDTGWINTGLPGTNSQFGATHNIFPNVSGADSSSIETQLQLQNITNQAGYTTGQIIENPTTNPGGFLIPFSPISTPNSITYQTGSSAAFEIITTSGSYTTLTSGSWSYRIIAKRGW